jgi:hypothetical protein
MGLLNRRAYRGGSGKRIFAGEFLSKGRAQGAADKQERDAGRTLFSAFNGGVLWMNMDENCSTWNIFILLSLTLCLLDNYQQDFENKYRLG